MDIFEFIKFSIEEEHKAFDKLFRELTDNDLSYSIGDDQTIGSRLRHITLAEYKMATYLFKDDNDIEMEVDGSSVQSLKKAFQISKVRNLQTIENLTLSDLDKIWKSSVSGNEYSYTFLLYHFIEHMSTHRGQVLMAFRLSKI